MAVQIGFSNSSQLAMHLGWRDRVQGRIAAVRDAGVTARAQRGNPDLLTPLEHGATWAKEVTMGVCQGTITRVVGFASAPPAPESQHSIATG